MRQDEEPRETTEEGLFERKALSRRDFLKYGGLAGAAIGLGAGFGGVIAACGGTTEETTTTAAAVTTTGAGPATTAGATTTVAAGPAQDKIVIGAARPVSGALSSFEESAFGPAYKLWVQDVNAAGGINVGGKKLPVEMLVYDDQSDLDTSMRLLTKLIEEDKVDFVFAPTSTAFIFAAAGVANAHKYILISSEGGATSLEQEMQEGGLPYFFQCMSYSNHNQMPVFADLLKEQGAKTVSIVYLDDLHGIEYQAQAQVFLSAAGIEILSNTAIPGDIKDMSTIVKKMQEENPDVVCSFAYPPHNILFLQTMMQLGFSPKGVLMGPGSPCQWFYDSFAGALEGVMFEGAWSVHSTPEAKAYYDKLIAYLGGPANVDFWGSLILRAQLEFFQQAIEQAATLDQDKIAEVMRTAHFKTSMTDDFFFTSQILDNSSYAGQIGQWQKGLAEVIDPGVKRTATPIYPKAPWPKA
jgi:branched-chain amino acid transport system substrate-binding protein